EIVQCRVVPFDGSGREQLVGPGGATCMTGAWSPDGDWIYLSTNQGWRYHIWRQRFPGGEPEQVTSGPTEEDGIAMALDGRSFLTSVGTNIRRSGFMMQKASTRCRPRETRSPRHFQRTKRSCF